MQHKYCYFDGAVRPMSDCGIRPDDLGVTRGYGVCDFLRAYESIIFLFPEHFARLVESAHAMRIPFAVSEDMVHSGICEILERNECRDAAIKIILTAGPAVRGMESVQPLLYAITEDLPKYSDDIYQHGATMIVSEYLRDFPKVKTTNYSRTARLEKQKSAKGAIEVLYTHNGRVLEASRSNFFIFRDDTLVTPCDDVLFGITRGLALRLARDNFVIKEREVPFSELKDADEAFITSTTKEIMPIVRVDDIPIGDGTVGKNTKVLMEAFQKEKERILKDAKPA